MATDSQQALIGRTISGKYLLESFLGGGAMGAVYQARQMSLDKLVAIKVMHQQLAVDDTFAARFHREARAASRLDHPSSIRVFDFGEEPDGLLYIAMELCEGRDLHHVIAEDGQLSDERIVDILSQVLAALAVAHEMGVVHRDLKPENILVQRGINDEGHGIDVVKVCDFGIATIVDPRSDRDAKGAARSNITGTGFVIGTPEYMSPEQARGELVDQRSDLYSVGVVLYQLLTGILPFDADSALGVAVKHLYDEPTDPAAMRVDASPHLTAICLKTLQKKPNDRYQSAREMRAALRSQLDPKTNRAPTLRRLIEEDSITEPLRTPGDDLIHGSSPTTTMPSVPPTQPTPHPLPRRLSWLASLFVLLLVLAGIVLFLLSGPTSETESEADDANLVTMKGQEAPSAAPGAPLQAPTLEPRPGGSAPLKAPSAPSETPSSKGSAAAPPVVRAPLSTSASAPEPAPAAPPPTVEAIKPPEPPAPSVVVTAPPPTTPAPEPTPTAPAFDPTTARVSIGGVSTTNGLPASSVRSALGRAQLTLCYQNALRTAGAAAGGAANLHLAIDDTGHVTSATAAMSFLPTARACIEGAARSLRISNVDTGDATADIALSFLPR